MQMYYMFHELKNLESFLKSLPFYAQPIEINCRITKKKFIKTLLEAIT